LVHGCARTRLKSVLTLVESPNMYSTFFMEYRRMLRVYGPVNSICSHARSNSGYLPLGIPAPPSDASHDGRQPLHSLVSIVVVQCWHTRAEDGLTLNTFSSHFKFDGGPIHDKNALWFWAHECHSYNSLAMALSLRVRATIHCLYRHGTFTSSQPDQPSLNHV
jgi:hypothetical protein